MRQVSSVVVFMVRNMKREILVSGLVSFARLLVMKCKTPMLAGFVMALFVVSCASDKKVSPYYDFNPEIAGEPNLVEDAMFHADKIGGLVESSASRERAEAVMSNNQPEEDMGTFRRMKGEADLNDLLKDFHRFPERYSTAFRKIRKYPDATFIGLGDDAYCVLYFENDVIVDGQLL